MGILDIFRKSTFIYKRYYYLRYVFPYLFYGDNWSIKETKRKFKSVFGREIDLENPKTLNEKIQWLKLYDHDEYYTLCADKFEARKIWEKYGSDGLIPLYYHTYNWKDISKDVIPDCPCIVKCNSASACYKIIREPAGIDINELRRSCNIWLFKAKYYYVLTQEWQYKNIKPCIIIEKLLLDEKGHIPNDYKLHFINGELTFIYCSVDREGANYRLIYDKYWNRTDIEWVEKEKHTSQRGVDIPLPYNFDRMVEIGKDIAKKFKYVRVDFYEVGKKLYYGEITLHHGSGYDTFVPEKYDYVFGDMLKLNS